MKKDKKVFIDELNLYAKTRNVNNIEGFEIGYKNGYELFKQEIKNVKLSFEDAIKFDEHLNVFARLYKWKDSSDYFKILKKELEYKI